ncbi:MAG: hypothetical protein Q4Q58_00965 [Thermoplasmata archaeon]|nr:hypothetical protein [Thermoplasmata archaeon]
MPMLTDTTGPAEAVITVHLSVIALVMVSAVVSDIRSRHVGDLHWAAMVAVGVPAVSISTLESAGAATAVCYAAGCCLMSAYMLSERISGGLAVPVVIASAAAFAAPSAFGLPGAQACSSALFTVFFFAGLHQTGLIAGGADAKCLMSLTMVLPEYPSVGGLPLTSYPSVLPPAMAVLALALLMTLVWGIRIPAANISAGYFGRGMATSVSVPVHSADPVRQWPVERLSPSGIVRCAPSADEASSIIEELRSAGVENVRVTPVVPFIAPIALALAVILVIGLPIA